MSNVVALADVQGTKEQLGTPGNEIWRTHFLKPVPGTGEPQAFLIEYAPARILRTHFHDVDEFQIVVSGDGMLGKHAIGPFDIHFASAFTPYGPLVAGAQGLSFLTLRAYRDSAGPQFWPGNRLVLSDLHGRDPWQVFQKVDLLERGGSLVSKSLTHLTGRCGLAGWVLNIPPNMNMQLPAALGPRGQYAVVVDGSIRIESRTLQAPIIGFAASGEMPLTITSGKEGAALIVLNFPESDAIGGLQQREPVV